MDVVSGELERTGVVSPDPFGFCFFKASRTVAAFSALVFTPEADDVGDIDLDVATAIVVADDGGTVAEVVVGVTGSFFFTRLDHFNSAANAGTGAGLSIVTVA